MALTKETTRPPKVKVSVRRGREYRYYRHPSGRLVPLPSDCEYGSDRFRDAYATALASSPEDTAPGATSREKRRAAVIRQNLYAEAIDRAIKRAKNRARDRGRECDLDRDFLLGMLASQGYRCAVTGLPFSPASEIASPFSLSIDRKNSERGYTPSNVRLVLHAVNVAINEWGDEVFFTICAAAMNRRFSQKERK